MADRISSDHDDVETHRAPLETVGRTDRVRVVVPEEATDDLVDGDVVELFLDGDRHYARAEATLEGALAVRRATDNRRQAREDDGENRLRAWVAAADVRVGGSVHLDVVTPGAAYGVRTPGTTVVYRVTERPPDSLADIAAEVERGSDSPS